MTASGEPETAPKRRRVELTSLVAGIVFLALALAFAVADLDSLEDQVRIVWPSSMLAIGFGMLLGARQSRR